MELSKNRAISDTSARESGKFFIISNNDDMAQAPRPARPGSLTHEQLGSHDVQQLAKISLSQQFKYKHQLQRSGDERDKNSNCIILW